MFDEVAYPELLNEDFTPVRHQYYCAYCVDGVRAGNGWALYAVKDHVKSQHRHRLDEGDPQQDVDFFLGCDLGPKLIAWRQAQREAADALILHFESLKGVDDFLLECGQ